MTASDISVTIQIDAADSDPVLELTATVDRRIELGRLDCTRTPPETLFKPIDLDGVIRVPVAPVSQNEVSRRQLLIESVGSGRVRLTNVSTSIILRMATGLPLAPSQAEDASLPTSIHVGKVLVCISSLGAATASDSLQTLTRPALSLRGGVRRDILLASLQDMPVPAMEGLIGWWRDVIDVLQSATNSDDFFHKATQAVVRLIGLDLGAVFLFEQGTWRPAVIETVGSTSARPSKGVLARVLAEKRTFFSRIDRDVDVNASLAALDSFVAAPLMDRHENVIGALYGHRSFSAQDGSGEAISHLEACLVEVLACGVAAGLARLEQEKTALARKVQFEQFFSTELAGELESHPDLLNGRDQEVTVLFCDIRGFSRVSERLAPAQTMEWIGDVLSVLSEEVVATGGVLVDYVGDELLAMWGAPKRQEDHAARACHAARRMLRQAASLSERWQTVVGASTEFGIGISSSLARVGNIGSTRKFKYGPLGNGVNLGSRVQGATKYLRVPVLVTGATRRLFGSEFLSRRLCSVRVVNILEPVDLYELDCTNEATREKIFRSYEEALLMFENREFAGAARALGNLLAVVPGDGPSLVLLSRAVDCMIREPPDFSPVWDLPGK
jgi:adenylate cyclase